MITFPNVTHYDDFNRPDGYLVDNVRYFQDFSPSYGLNIIGNLARHNQTQIDNYTDLVTRFRICNLNNYWFYTEFTLDGSTSTYGAGFDITIGIDSKNCIIFSIYEDNTPSDPTKPVFISLKSYVYGEHGQHYYGYIEKPVGLMPANKYKLYMSFNSKSFYLNLNSKIILNKTFPNLNSLKANSSTFNKYKAEIYSYNYPNATLYFSKIMSGSLAKSKLSSIPLSIPQEEKRSIAIKTSKTAVKQPRGNMEVNWSNSLTNNLKHLFVAPRAIDLVTGKSFYDLNYYSRVFGANTFAYNFPGITVNIPNDSFSLFYIARTNPTQSSSTMRSRLVSSAAVQYILDFYTDTVVSQVLIGTTGFSASNGLNRDPPHDTTPIFVLGNFFSGGSNPVTAQSFNTQGNGNLTTLTGVYDSQPFGACTLYPTAGYGFEYTGLYSLAKTADEARELKKYPWSIVKECQPKFYSLPSRLITSKAIMRK